VVRGGGVFRASGHARLFTHAMDYDPLRAIGRDPAGAVRATPRVSFPVDPESPAADLNAWRLAPSQDADRGQPSREYADRTSSHQ
jgi:hypothetical protein